MEITIYVIMIWVTAVFIGSLAAVIYFGGDRPSSKAFAFSIFLVTIWTIVIGLFFSTHDFYQAAFYNRMTYLIGTAISVSFLYFILIFPEDLYPRKILLWAIVISEGIFCYLYFFTNTMIARLLPTSLNLSYGWWVWQFGPLSFIFELYFFSLFATGLYMLYNKYKAQKDPGIRKNLRFMLVGLLMGIIPPSLTSIILPRFGYFDLNWLGPVSGIFWVFIIAYSIIRHRQMSVRIVVTEVLAIGMAVIFFINIFINTPFGVWGRAVTFLTFLTLATYLIRGVLKEAKQKVELNDLNRNLSQKVAEQTDEIRKSYEAEKQARQELEKLNDAKDQFIMITQHHLRTPLVSVMWEIESVANGVYGAVTAELRKAIAGMKTSTDRLMQIVNDFLNITAIKIGTNILNLSEQSLKSAIEYIIQQLAPEIRHMDIKIDYPRDDSSWPKLKIDYDKMREILLIVIENAVRYNHPGGSVAISTGVSDGAFELTVQNTGIGISDEEKQKIGSALFYRGASARKSHPIGMGIGLAVVKAIVRAHHGTFKIESLGEGRGAKATISLPVQ